VKKIDKQVESIDEDTSSQLTQTETRVTGEQRPSSNLRGLILKNLAAATISFEEVSPAWSQAVHFHTHRAAQLHGRETPICSPWIYTQP